MRRFPLLGLLATLSACLPQAGSRPQSSPPPYSSEAGASSAFVADPNSKITVGEWNALLLNVKSLPGARIEEDKPMLLSIRVGAPNEPAFYVFTQSAHSAHPAYLKLSPSQISATETTLQVGYAGSRSEFETFVRDFLAHVGGMQ